MDTTKFVDPWLSRVDRYKELGYSQDNIFMSLAVKHDLDDEAVSEAKLCSYYVLNSSNECCI